MSKITKLWLLIATSAIVVGCLIFAVVMTLLGWDFSKLSTFQYQTNEYRIDGDFTNIKIDVITADVTLIPWEEDYTRVVCHEQEKVTHSVSVENGTLVVSAVDTRKWYEYIGVNFNSPEVTVYLPKEQYSDIVINTTTGDISVEHLTARKLDITVSTGDVVMTDIRCSELVSDGNTGNVTLNHVIATGRFDIELDTGDVYLNHCDAGEIDVETDTGDVTGSLLSDKVFDVETDTGDVDVPGTTSGGKCEISTDTGDIRITIVKK